MAFIPPPPQEDKSEERLSEMRNYLIPIWGFPAEMCGEEMLKSGINKNYPGGLEKFLNDKDLNDE